MNTNDELMLDSAGPTATGFEIRTHAGGPQTAETLLFIADSMRSALDEYDAPNYLEMEVNASDGKHYILTLQRKGKVTPHQARVAAEEALAASRPRTITTTEEVDALPHKSVVLTPFGDAVTIYRSHRVPPENYHFLVAEGRTATVIHEPQENQ